MKLVCVIVTKDRPEDLRRCLASIVSADQIIIVDGSITAKTVAKEFQCAYYQSKPGITRQRNLARQHIPSDTDIVVYCDDDTELSPNTLIKVREIFAAQPEVVGLTGNLDQTVKHNFFKRLFGRLSLTYTKQPYGFTTGIFNIINSVTQPTKVDWLPGAFMCYRWSVVQDIIFDEWFTEYGLGEDFDFSYRVGTLGILLADPSIVVAHHHSQVNRNWKKFGYMRLVNRNYLRVKLWPKQGLYWLGMWWSNMWLLAMPYRPEWIGEMQGLLTILLKRAIFPRYENNLYRTKGYPSTGRRR